MNRSTVIATMGILIFIGIIILSVTVFFRGGELAKVKRTDNEKSELEQTLIDAGVPDQRSNSKTLKILLKGIRDEQ